MNITNYVIECIKEHKPISFCKYGDGEYYAASGNYGGKNCDDDRYTPQLRQGIIDSFTYMVDHADNAYLGLWHGSIHKNFWESLVQKTPKWVDYHTIILDEHGRDEKINLFKEVKESKLKKIIICNRLLVKSKILLDIDYMVNVPLNNWFDTMFDTVLQNVLNIMQDGQQYIVITSCGMGAKVLVCELVKRHPGNIYLDFGSVLDHICTKKDTRGSEINNYERLEREFSDMLPEQWNLPIYDYIYPRARKELGLYIPEHLSW